MSAADARGSSAMPQVSAPWAVVVRSFAFLRKEVVEIVRQPRLILLLVVGPFALLMMFGFGYSESSIRKRAVFVGSEESVYADVLTTYEEQLSDFIESKGLVASVADGRAMLVSGEADVVVVFPEDAEQTVMTGERAVIEVLHDEIDPIQEGAVEVAARLAIQEVNATVLATLATEAQDRLAPSGEIAEELLVLAERLGDDPVAASEAIDDELARLTPALDGTATVLSRLELEDDGALEQLEETRMAAATVVDRAEGLDDTATSDQIDELATALVSLADHLDETIVLDPEVLVRPFESSTENVLTESIRPNDYFTPASLALLLQHLALTFAALSLVRDRRTGLFELMRVGPLSSIEIVLGKIFAYLLVGTIVGAALICGAVFGLGVTFTGSIGWLVVVVVGVLLASLALGMLLATLAATESQAVQYAMLALLGGLFFSGFILPISGLSYPVKLVSFLLPVTYGIATLQDIMLRGSTPAPWALTGLAALIAVYGAIAVLGLRRRLRTGGATS